MIFYQCKCGERTSWSSMGVMSCVVCEKCGSTLAEGPNAHLAPQPHKWELQWHIDAQSGERWQERVCVRCRHTERVESPADVEPDAAAPYRCLECEFVSALIDKVDDHERSTGHRVQYPAPSNA